MKLPTYISHIQELQPLFDHANHIDVKTVKGDVSMREFIAGMLSYQPGWMTFLYGVRAVFVRTLGMRQAGIPTKTNLSPSQINMQPGQSAGFFKVRTAKEEAYWAVEAEDKHLKATLVVVIEPINPKLKRFYVITIVHYHHWTGPVYFNVIRPFHHLVVGQMAKAGVRPFDTVRV